MTAFLFMYACALDGYQRRRKAAACVSPSRFQVMPVGFPRRATRGEIQTEQAKEKEQKGENMAAEDYHFYIKRMLSQQSSRAAPVNCDTVQLLVTPSKARWKPTVSHASTLFIK